MTQTAIDYEVVIGLEVHCQILTRSKMFCGCSAEEAGAPENSHVCPVCLGMPGVLPVVNKEAVIKTVMTGLALNCRIPEHAKFDRKNYHYPDLMKGYQISQYDLPFCVDGWLEVEAGGETKRIGITRVHLEEDTARMKHVEDFSGEGYSLVDVNRSGVPLMEIVSEPDIRSPEEAREYLVKLRAILRAIGASLANMEEGNFRCDANISLRPRGATEFGTKVEVKNMNSFRSVQRALEYEIVRQSTALDAGEPIVQETRGWVVRTFQPSASYPVDESGAVRKVTGGNVEDLSQGRTVSQRSKEQAHDYRYFPEPDLPPFTLTRQFVEEIRARLPELPDAKKKRFIAEYGLTDEQARLLSEPLARADYFEEAVKSDEAANRRDVARDVTNWILIELARLFNADQREFDEAAVVPKDLQRLTGDLRLRSITRELAREMLEYMYRNGASYDDALANVWLKTPDDDAELEAIVRRAIEQNPKPVADYRAGKAQALNALFGPVMRETKGRYPADRVRALLQSALE